jgi:signal transduction histidine kinase
MPDQPRSNRTIGPEAYHLKPWQRVSTVLLVSMVLLACLIFAMGAVAYFQVQTTQSIVKESMVRSDGRYLSTRIRVESLLLSDLMLQYVIHDGADDRVRLRVIFEESSRRIDELFRQAFNTFEGREWVVVEKVNTQVKSFLQEGIKLMDTRDQEGGYGVRSKEILAKITILREPMLDAVRSLEDIETDSLDKARRKAGRFAERSLWVIASVGGGVLFLALFVTFLNIQRIFFPLIDIQRAVESIANGKLDHPIHAARQDEFGVLAQAFNHMMAQMRTLIGSLEQRVAHRTEQLVNANKQLEDEIIVRRHAEEEVIQAFNELKKVQRQLIHSEKMATVGQLAAGVVHEINNPVAFLINNMEMLKEYLQAISSVIDRYAALEKAAAVDHAKSKALVDELDVYKKEVNFDFLLTDIKELLGEMDSGLEHIKKIVLDLKTFSHSDNERKEVADVNQLIDVALNIARNELKYKATVIKQCSNLPLISCYPQQLSQVFINLLVNAAQAIQDKGSVTIKTAVESDKILIEIKDTGSGMTEEVLSHLFEPFYTTKPAGLGTGLGLSISYNIIQKHRGEISAQSVVDQGSVFMIRIPVKNDV